MPYKSVMMRKEKTCMNMFTELRSLEIIFIVHWTILLFQALTRRKWYSANWRLIGDWIVLFCFECEHVTALENMKLASKESSCIHVQLCSVLFSDMTCEKTHKGCNGNIASFSISIKGWIKTLYYTKQLSYWIYIWKIYAVCYYSGF